MQGLELARKFYEEYGKAMLRDAFPEWESMIAVGLCGSGSECFGFDDDVSRDHDFEPGFCLFLPGEDVIDRRTAFQLERAYAKLPREFMGVRRLLVAPVGGSRHGVFRTAEFFTEKAGTPDGELSDAQWLSIPSYALAEAVNGAIFRDDLGEVTAIRRKLSAMPDDVRLKKLAGRLLLMAQSGQYNYARCLAHGETGAARLAVCEFVQNTTAAVFLLNRRHMPFYKWSLRAMRELPTLSALAQTMERLLTGGSDETGAAKQQIEEAADAVVGELRRQSLTDAVCSDLEQHAYAVHDRIQNPALRSSHILSAV